MENLSGRDVQGYNLLERIGAGGFGAVYRANQSTIGREVAVKVILPAFANKPEFIRRFEIEAQLVARLEHLHIVPLYDYWRDPNGAYIVMRWLRGGSLGDALRNGAFDLQPASLLLDQVASGLAIAHQQQIVHRDLKPSNILLDEEGNAYLADFGIAIDLRHANGVGAGSSFTSGGNGNPPDNGRGNQVLGSIQYLSPEQLRGQEVTPLSDIYSLGVCLYEVLANQHPFPGLNSIQQLYKHINEPLPRIDLQDSRISEGVNEVIQKATAKDPKRRYQDALAMAGAFRDSAGLNHDSQTVELVESLTRREQEILHLIIEANTNQQIAQALFLELSTIKWHVNRIYKKLGVRSRVQAVVRARELDLIISNAEPDLESSDKSSISVVLPEPVNPYKGLRAFEPADNRNFFGRETLVEKLLARLSPSDAGNPGRSAPGSTTNGSERFLTIVGPSGSGKSSLTKAGLIPALWSGQIPGSDKWYIVEMLSSSQPLDDLEIALTRIAADQAGNLRDHLDRDSQGLARAAKLILPNDESELVLVIDQFEELFTQVKDETVRDHFIKLIQEAVAEPRGRVRVIITLRADYYDRPLQYPNFGELVMSHLETLLPLSAGELERAIVEPAHQAGVTFEPGLVTTIIEDVNYRPGALPLLQFALAELFEQRDGRTLTHDAYHALGGAVGALARRAEELYQEQDSDGREAIRQMFLRLVTLSDQGAVDASDVPTAADTRKRVPRAELLSAAKYPERLDEIIDTYAGYRLLSLDHHPKTRRATVEVAHEAILREWNRLRSWLQESLVDLSLRHQLVQATHEWNEADGDPSFLLRGSRLGRFENWAGETQLVLTKGEQAYLQASVIRKEERAAAERERDENEARLQQQSNRRLKALAAVLALALVVALGLSIAAVSFAQRVEEQQQLVEEKDRLNYIQGLASAARINLELDPELSVLLALEAAETTYSTDGTLSPEVEGLLRDAVQADRIQQIIQSGGEVVYSPDGKTIAIGNEFGVVRAWDTTTGKVTDKLIIHRPLISGMAFSPDGRFLATSNGDTVVNIWDFASGQFIGAIEPPRRINDIAFNPDGLQLLTAGADGVVWIWDLLPLSSWSTEDAGPVELSEHSRIDFSSKDAAALAVSPDGHRAAVLFPGESIIVVDLESGQQLLEINGIDHFAREVFFSPDGRHIASITGYLTATVWDAETGEELISLQESGTIKDIAFSPDGRFLATAADNHVSTLWEVETGREHLRLTGYPELIKSISFSPDGRQLATSSTGWTTRLWDVDLLGDEPLMYSVVAHQGKVHDAVFNVDGTKFASAGEDGSIKLWETATGRMLHDLPGQMDWAHFPAFSPDGRSLAAANREGGITIWDAETGEELLVLFGDAPAFTAVAFSPDGQMLAAGGRSLASEGQASIAHIWDTSTGQRLTKIQYGGEYITELVFSPDGNQIRTYDFAGLENAWDPVTGEHLGGLLEAAELGNIVDIFVDVHFTQDGQLGAAACTDALVFNSGSKLENIGDVHWYDNPGGAVTGVALNSDGSRLATSSTNGLAKLWDMESGAEIATISDRTPSLGGVDYSPDGRYLATAGSDGLVSIYIMSIDELVEVARSRLSRSLTNDECLTYLHRPCDIGQTSDDA